MKRVSESLVFDSDGATRAGVLAQARAHLIGRGMDPFDADDALAAGQGLVVRAWWGGDDVGFVQEGHPNAAPVIVVNIPEDEAAAPAVKPPATRVA